MAHKRPPFPAKKIPFSSWFGPALIVFVLFFGAFAVQIGFRPWNTAHIGGRYALTDVQGHAVTQASFSGRQTLIYFGYTRCLDVCPLTLATVAEALRLLRPEYDKPVPLFITLDPEHDTPDAVERYVRHFSDEIVGLTGSRAEIAAVSQAFHVTANTVLPNGMTDYRIDHSSVLYLMDGHNRLLAVLPVESSPRDVAVRLSRFLPKH